MTRPPTSSTLTRAASRTRSRRPRSLAGLALLGLLILALAPAIAPPVSAGEPDKAQSEALARKGSGAFRDKKLEAAERAFRRALELWPDNGPALNGLAWQLLTTGSKSAERIQEARRLAERACRIDPTRAAWLDTLATALAATGEPFRAARLQLRAVRRNRRRVAMAETLVRIAGEAVAAARGRPELRAEMRGLLARGLRALAAHQPAKQARVTRERALKVTREALRDSPKSPEALAAVLPPRALLLAELKRWRGVERVAGRALGLTLDEADRRALGGARAEALMALKRPAEAAAVLAELVRDRPGATALHRRLVAAWRAADRPREAAAAMAGALAALERHPPLWLTRERADMHRLAATLHRDAARRTEGAERTHHRRSRLASLVRSAASRATDDKLDETIRSAAATLDSSLATLSTPELRARLGEQVLGLSRPPRFERRSLPGSLRGSRVAAGDVDGDGDPDLLLNGHALALNRGAAGFVDARRALPRCPGARGGVLADIDGDGDLDIAIAGGGPAGDRLLRNDTVDASDRSQRGGLVVDGRRLRFVDISAELPISDDAPSEGLALGDLNGDGRLDLYFANYERKFPGPGTKDRLWLSGPQGYRDASDAVHRELFCGRGVTMADFDQDGDLDIFVANYRLHPDLLFVGDGRGGFTEEARARGVRGVPVRGAYGHTIGAEWGDLDGDGDLDLVAANLAHPRFITFSDKTMIYLQGDGPERGRFRDVRAAAGVEFEETHSDPTLLDIDNDGDLDLFLTSIYPGRPSYLYRNITAPGGPLRFEDVTWAAGARVFNGWGAATADLDGDGAQDLIACAGGTPVLLYNRTPSPGRALRIRLRGRSSEPNAAGATVTLSDATGRRLVRQLHLGKGTATQSEPILHFGLGDRPGPFTATVRWLSGWRTRHTLTLLDDGERAKIRSLIEPAGEPEGR